MVLLTEISSIYNNDSRSLDKLRSDSVQSFSTNSLILE